MLPIHQLPLFGASLCAFVNAPVARPWQMQRVPSGSDCVSCTSGTRLNTLQLQSRSSHYLITTLMMYEIPNYFYQIRPNSLSLETRTWVNLVQSNPSKANDELN